MTELITIYHQSDFTTPILALRSEVYTHRNTVYGEHYVASVGAFIFTPEGKMILQRRASHKSMGGKIQSSMAGHINPSETDDFVLSKECLEEVGYSATVIPENLEWEVGYESIAPFLYQTICCMKLAQYEIRFSGENGINHGFYTTDYLGILAGPPKNYDGSVSEFITQELEEIDQDLLQPNEFTSGFPHYYKRNRDRLYEFRDMIRSQLNE